MPTVKHANLSPLLNFIEGFLIGPINFPSQVVQIKRVTSLYLPVKHAGHFGDMTRVTAKYLKWLIMERRLEIAN